MPDPTPQPLAEQPRIIVQPSPDPHWEQREWLVAHVRRIAWLMDSAFVVPGTNYRIGLDPIIGLIPVLGDLIGVAISGYLMWLASRVGVPKAVLLRMMLNVGIDLAVGSVPVVGDTLDAAWKANAKNAALLERALADPKRTARSSVWMLIGLSVLFVALAAGAVLLTVWLFKLLVRAFE